MPERTKLVVDFEFFFADHRYDSRSAFAGTGFTYDKEAGDALAIGTDGATRLKRADGWEIYVPAGFLWAETRERKVVVQEPLTPGPAPSR